MGYFFLNEYKKIKKINNNKNKLKMSFDIILASTLSGGIGYHGKLPWNLPKELEIFKNKTMNSILIVGRKTAETLPKLPGRELRIVSGKNTFENVIAEAVKDGRKVFVIGGETLFNYIFSIYIHNCKNLPKLQRVHLSIVTLDVPIDSRVNFIDYLMSHDFLIETENNCDNFSHYTLLFFPENSEKKYLKLANDLMTNYPLRKGRNGFTVSSFSNNLMFNLQQGFPLLTTKKMAIKSIVKEFLFFIQGKTDTNILEEQNVKIWKGNTSRQFLDSIGKYSRKEGIFGPLYGYQWRYFNAKYDETTGRPLGKGVDQLENVINLIKTDPGSRRILLTSYNPEQVDEGVLYPCHSIIVQFYVTDEYLDMFCYNRSSDLFLGVPFNIASSSLLLSVISKLTGKIPRFLHLTMGDTHIYEQHLSVMQEQIMRQPYTFPELKIKKSLSNLSDIDSLSPDDFEFINYRSQPALKAEMVV